MDDDKRVSGLLDLARRRTAGELLGGETIYPEEARLWGLRRTDWEWIIWDLAVTYLIAAAVIAFVKDISPK